MNRNNLTPALVCAEISFISKVLRRALRMRVPGRRSMRTNSRETSRCSPRRTSPARARRASPGRSTPRGLKATVENVWLKRIIKVVVDVDAAQLGTPQGLAVYQNGVRINEAFGDTVDWHLFPDIAINRVELVRFPPTAHQRTRSRQPLPESLRPAGCLGGVAPHVLTR
jgi:hypothetical protein